MKTIFALLVQAVDVGHFSKSDIPLLTQYAIACHQADEAAAELQNGGLVLDGRPSPWLVPWEKATRTMTALSMRLRLSPQSRYDRLVAGTTSRPQFRPWDPDGLLAQPEIREES